MHLFAQKEVKDLYASPVEAAKYYVEQVRPLADFCRTTDWPYYYFDAELHQRVPETLLPTLSRWLELDSPLSTRYQTFSQTGKAGRGDSSGRIHSGSIDKTKIDYSHIAIPENAMSRAQTVYRECRERMIKGAADSATL